MVHSEHGDAPSGTVGSPGLDPRRTFTRREIRLAWELQGEVCKLCGRAIPFDLMHGDHIEPWSQGGPTTTANLQALCGSCNLRKGSRPQAVIEAFFDVDQMRAGDGVLRRWQEEALALSLDRIRHKPVLVEACPGAGKTRFGLEIAYRLLTSGFISRVIIIVPTLGIADGWQNAASRSISQAPNLPLHGPRDWRPVNPIGDKWVGAVVTYQSLFAATEVFLAHATDPGHRTLVIFDEVHHAGTDASWGESAQVAFAAGAKAILSLSGTPFRTAGDPIIFVPSEGGSARPDYRYSYDEAIRDRACRPVQFVEARGTTTFRTEDGEVHTVSFDEHDLTSTGERRRLRAALEWVEQGSIADKMLRDANQYLIGLRGRGDHDAGALVVCVDCDHAAAVAAHLETLLGRRPTFACSRMHDENDPNPADAIRRFASSHDPWIVAVNMVSEGIDITRLRAVVYLTNRLTLLSFRQIVGRVVRTDPSNVDDHGRVYIPADSRLVEMARQVTDQVDLLPPPMVIVTDPSGPATVRIHDDNPTDRVSFETLGSVARQGNAFDTAGREAEAILIQCARLFIDREGLTGTDAESLAIMATEVPALREQLLALQDEL